MLFFNYLQQYTKLYTSSHHCAFGYFPTDAIGGMELSPIKCHCPIPPSPKLEFLEGAVIFARSTIPPLQMNPIT